MKKILSFVNSFVAEGDEMKFNSTSELLKAAIVTVLTTAFLLAVTAF